MLEENLSDSPDAYVLTASERLAYRRTLGLIPTVKPPASFVLCFQPSLLRSITRRHSVRRVKGFFGEVYFLGGRHPRVGVAGNFGIGAPASVVFLEDLVAFGVSAFLSIGLAGGLQEDSRSGDMVVCDKAIRDEGTSRHYLAQSAFSYADTDLIYGLQQALQKAGKKFNAGTSWTTDAPYRESRAQVMQHRQDGVLTVEMEAAALFAAGQALGVKVGSAFVIADTLSGLKWNPVADPKHVHFELEDLFLAALETLS